MQNKKDKIIEKSTSNLLTVNEKEQLKTRINHSVKKERNSLLRKLIYVGSVAASIVALVVLAPDRFYNLFHSSDILEFSKATNQKIKFEGQEEVRLILNNKEEVEIKEENIKISYSKSGKNIKINKSKSVAQDIEDPSKTVYNSIVVPYGRRSQVILSEGTIVWLNSGTKFTYPTNFKGGKREVHLEGEAIFEVSHNKEMPFYVHTNDYKVKVLGTVFNVSSYNDEGHTSTALASGSVEILYNNTSFFGRKSIKISPGTLATYNRKNQEISKKEVDVKKYMSWKEGVFIFKKEPLTSILKKISRYYNIPIQIENKNLVKETFSGYLDLKEDLESVLDIIKITTSIKYYKKDQLIIIN